MMPLNRSSVKGLSDAEADLCRYWALNGYVIIPGLFDDETLASVWEGYERAVHNGKLEITARTRGAGRSLPWPLSQPA